MEQNNNTNVVDKKMDELMEGMKADITKTVTEELASKGIEIVPMSYSAGADIVKIVDDYKSQIEEIDKKIEYNEKTYKDSKVMNFELGLDKKDLKRETLEKLDKTLEKQEMIQDRIIKDKQSSKEYKEAKGEALQMLHLLKDCDIPTEQLLDLISPLVEASDTKTLAIAHTLLAKNPSSAFAIDKAISGIEESRANSELKMMINTMKMYIEDGNENLRVFSYFKQYRK